MYFDLSPDSSSLRQMTTNYCWLGCLKRTLMATPLLTMLPEQKTLKTVRMYFDLLAHLSSLPQMATNYYSLRCSKPTLMATPLLRMTPP